MTVVATREAIASKWTSKLDAWRAMWEVAACSIVTSTHSVQIHGLACIHMHSHVHTHPSQDWKANWGAISTKKRVVVRHTHIEAHTHRYRGAHKHTHVHPHAHKLYT